jgi:uncharacterized protein (TIGR03437 family)
MRLLLTSTLTLAISGSLLGQTYTIQTIAGGALPNNMAGTSASLGQVLALAVDKTGNAYFSAGNYGVVLRLDAITGELTIAAGSGIVGYSGDNGPATSAKLGPVTGIAVDSAGNLFILDQGRVREVSNGIITTVAGDGTFGYSGDGGPATSAQLNRPAGIAVDAAGNIYIADSGNNRIRKVANGTITTVAGNGTPGYAGDGGVATLAELNGPTGLAVDPAGNLYFADTGNSRVRKLLGPIIALVAGNGTPGFSGDGGPPTHAELLPTGVAVDAAGNLYIADSSNRIREVSNGVITTVAGNSTQGYSGDGGSATSAQLSDPLGVAVDSAGNLFIADAGNSRVRKVARGVIDTVAGGGGVGDGGPASTAQLDVPLGIAIDPIGELYIADEGSNRVRMVSNGVITTVAGNGTAGFSGDQGPANIAELSAPLAVAVDSMGDLYVTATSSVRKISKGVITSVVAPAGGGGPCGSGPDFSAGLIGPYGIAIGPSGNLYVTNTWSSCVIEVSSGAVATVAGAWFNPGYSGDSGPAVRSQLNEPQGVAVDAAGNLYIADSYNSVVRRVSNGVITTVAGNGTQGFSGDNGPATSAQLFIPTSIALDAAGNLFIVDYANNRVRKVSGGVIATIAGTGTPGLSGDGGPATAASLNGPWGITVDPAGTVYVSDSGSNRIRMLVPSGTSTCTYNVSPLSFTATKAGASLTATVQTPAGCAWAAGGLPGWMALSGDAVSTGPGSVAVNISANSGNERTVFINIAGISIQVTQQGLLSIDAGGVVNAASYAAPVAPGSIAAVFGDFPLTSPVTATGLPLEGMLPLPGSIWDFFLDMLDGHPPLFYASAGQVNFQVPWEFAGQSQTTLAASTGPTNVPGTAQTVTLAPFAPGIFAVNSQGTGQGAVLDTGYRLVDASNPAAGSSTVLIYCTGLGAVTNPPPTGSPASLTDLSPTPKLPSVTIGGVLASVSFSGLAPGFVGLYQVNAQVPAGLAASNAVPVAISMEGAASNTVTIAIQ